MALGRIGPDAGAAVPDLIPLLGDKSERIRREAARSLGQIGSAAVGPLIGAVSHKDVIIRARAVESLGYLPAPDDRVIPIVAQVCARRGPAGSGGGVEIAGEVPDCPMTSSCRSSRRTSGTRTNTSGWRWSTCSPGVGRCSPAWRRSSSRC